MTRVIYHGYLQISRANSPKIQLCASSVCVGLTPIKVEKKRKDLTPSPSSTNKIIYLIVEEEYATFPVTKLSEKQLSIYELNEKESIVHHSRAWAALGTPANTQSAKILSAIP